MKPKKKITVAVSGGFDPLHPGHIRLFAAARKLGDRLVVILNNDNWLKAKKGYSFMRERERAEVIRAIRGVDQVVMTSHPNKPSDMSVQQELKKIKPDIFGNGGDRNPLDARNPKSSLYHDTEICRKLGIRMVFGLGKGGKVQSSSWLLNKFITQQGKTASKSNSKS